MKKGILITNLGSPKSPTIESVKDYLAEFLMDPYVLQMPYVLRAALVYGIILPLRPKKTLANYQKIWTEHGSPLINETKKLAIKLQKKTPLSVKYAMRYGEPSLDSILREFKKENISDVLVIPLYPQYALSTTETTVQKLISINKSYEDFFSFKFIKDFFDHPLFIEAQAQVIEKNLLKNKWDHLIFSYHGLPKSHLGNKVGATCDFSKCCNEILEKNRYCYRAQCFETTRKIAKLLEIPDSKYTVSFQSRLTRGWIEPFTDVIIESLPSKGIQNLAICCPSFVSDCLETLEEVQIGEKERFLSAGGKSFTYIPCLNDEDIWVKNLADLTHNELNLKSHPQEFHETP